jgi:two-component system, cell cycle sensor histidine kinase and response regulator CckA
MKNIQEEILQSRRMEVLSVLAGGVAHRFNNALSAITGNAELLEMELAGNDKLKRYATRMKESAHQMAHLSNQLLAYARGGKFNPEIISPTDFFKDTIPLIKETADLDITIETDLPEDILNIEADKAQMHMVLSAIITNSNDAMEDMGRIVIATRNVVVDEEFVKGCPALKPGPYVSISFEDDGIGMDQETKDRIFEPFFTTHFTVRGLDMAAAYGIIRNHDGWITVDSELGKGTRVVIYLPAVAGEAKEEEALHASGVSSTRTVLIVEDEEAVFDVTQGMLETLGYRVIVATTGKDAIHTVEAFDGQIDLALLDINLPDMEGGKLYPILMKARPNLKVIVFSGYTVDGLARKILDAGAQDFLQKPFSLTTLSEKLKKVLEGE